MHVLMKEENYSRELFVTFLVDVNNFLLVLCWCDLPAGILWRWIPHGICTARICPSDPACAAAM